MGLDSVNYDSFLSLLPNVRHILDDLVEDFKLKSKDNADSVNNNNYVENKKTGRLIVMDVSGLADCSNTFGSFLTVITKFSYHCLYIFHIIFQGKEI